MELSKALLFAFILFFPHALALDIFFNTSFSSICAKPGYAFTGCSFDDVRIWSSGTVPTAADTVTINGSASVTLVSLFASNSYTVASLSMQHAYLLITGPGTNFCAGAITLTQRSQLQVGGDGPMWYGNFTAEQLSLDNSILGMVRNTRAAFKSNVTLSNSSSIQFRCGEIVAEYVIIDSSSGLRSSAECSGSVHGNLINDGLTAGYGDGSVYVKGNFFQSATSTFISSFYPLTVTGSAVVGGTISYDLVVGPSGFKNTYPMIVAGKITGHFKKDTADPFVQDSPLPTMSIVYSNTVVSLVYYDWQWVWVPTLAGLVVISLIVIIVLWKRQCHKKRLARFTKLENSSMNYE